MKKLLSVLLALTLLCSVSAAMAEKLTMATEATFPPYEFVDESAVEFGGFAGIDVEIADAIAKKLGYEGVEVKDMEFGSVISDVATGKSMVAMAGLTANSERMQNVYFSFPYATGIQVVIVTEDSPITSVDDLFAEGASYKAGVQMNTTGDIYASDDLGEDNVVRFSSGADAVLALKNGKVDCVIIDNEPAKAYIANATGLKILETAYAEESYAIGVSKNNVELLGQVSAALQDLIADGTVQAIVDKYIKAN